LRALLALGCLGPSLAAGSPTDCPEALAAGIPARVGSAPAGAEFAAQILGRAGRERELAIEDQLLGGNVPGFLRRLRPVTLSARLPSGRTLTATICVTPDYLAVGSEADFLRVPMDLHTATAVASRLGFVLPTRKMVDAIHAQADAHLDPSPMTPGREMSSTGYYLTHDGRIRAQRVALGIGLDALVAGQKKDVVLSNLLARNPGRIAIYGWHRPDGRPIQPLSTVHGASYADYSHGVRLVSEVVYLDGEPSPIHAVLRDPERAVVLSDEGPLREPSALVPPRPTPVARRAGARAADAGETPG
jgi:hypothetical protein